MALTANLPVGQSSDRRLQDICCGRHTVWLVPAFLPVKQRSFFLRSGDGEQLIGDRVHEVHVDMGYRGHDYGGAATVHVDKRRRGRTPRTLWRWMKRRAAIEPSIGHLKNEHRLERNRLKGVAGNAINAILAAAAMNFHKLRGAFWPIFLRCLSLLGSGLLSATASEAFQDQPLCA